MGRSAAVPPELRAAIASSTSSDWSRCCDFLKYQPMSAAYLWSLEDTAATRGLEEALRQDLSMAMSDAMGVQVLTGNGTAPNIKGFLGGNGITIPADITGDDTKNSKYTDFRKLYTERVDGLYANDANQVRAVVSPKLYQYADGVFRSDESEDTGLMAAQRIGAQWLHAHHVRNSSNPAPPRLPNGLRGHGQPNDRRTSRHRALRCSVADRPA